MPRLNRVLMGENILESDEPCSFLGTYDFFVPIPIVGKPKETDFVLEKISFSYDIARISGTQFSGSKLLITQSLSLIAA